MQKLFRSGSDRDSFVESTSDAGVHYDTVANTDGDKELSRNSSVIASLHPATAPDRLRLREGHHWRHFPSPDQSKRVLAIFYSPVGVREPTLPYFKRTQSLAAGRLLISTFTDEFYQDCIGSIQEIVGRVSRDYDETIHYGYSMGAYAALRFGSVDPKAKAIFAMSPHFVLDRTGSRSARLMQHPTSPADNDVRPFVLSATGTRVFLAISCLDLMDSIQLLDAQSLSAPWIEKHFILKTHNLPSLNEPAQVVSRYLSDERFPEIRPEDEASQQDIEDCIAAFRLMEACDQKQVIDVEPRYKSRIPAYHYWQARYVSQQSRKWEALPWYMRAIEALKFWNLDLQDYAVSLGNALVEVGFHEAALGFYRQFQSQNPPVRSAYLCEASLLKRLRRADDLVTLAEKYRSLFGEDEVIDKIAEMAAEINPPS